MIPKDPRGLGEFDFFYWGVYTERTEKRKGNGSMIEMILFFGLPAAAIVFFVTSLCKFLSLRKRERQEPGSVAPEEMKKRKTMLILASCVAATLVAVVVGFVILIYMAIAYM